MSKAQFEGVSGSIANYKPDDRIITNDGFFPNIDTADIRSGFRILDSITADRLRQAVIRSMISVNQDLSSWKAAKIKDGASKLSDVSSDQIDGQSILTMQYFQAVGCYTRADLIDSYRDVDRTRHGRHEIDDLEPASGDLRRDAIHAIRDILGKTRTTAALI
ncbi:MAG: head completion/stabilization protein [Zymomonas mobilis]|uniref:head completion/stabilization protein n=1 Tax=Zymomonas mobilis TaxID=542 RepID=UPI0039E822DA